VRRAASLETHDASPTTRASGPATVLLVALALVAGVVGCAPSADPSPVPAASAAATPTATPAPTPTPSPTPAATPSPSPPPTASPAPAASPPSGRPTRIAIPALDIDLPVVNPPRNSTWPLCDVVEYFTPPTFQHPGAGGVTYIYGHAQAGMFLPILTWSARDPDRMIGRTVHVWTAKSHVYTYRIERVRRRQKSLDWAFKLPPNSLVLQTSEDQFRTGTKVMLVARQLTGPRATSYAAAHPKPKPRVCGR
jgi:hypothetical protein